MIGNTPLSEEKVVGQTKNWIRDVVIGCGFCPFASKVFLEDSIRYRLIDDLAIHTHSLQLLEELQFLDQHPEIETSLIIFSQAYPHFSGYLQLVQQSEKLLRRKSYEGIYQIASFHPDYVFAASAEEDAANYTNRSPYPMLHLLREERLEHALGYYPQADKIPERNVQWARQKGIDYMRRLLENTKIGTK